MVNDFHMIEQTEPKQKCYTHIEMVLGNTIMIYTTLGKFFVKIWSCIYFYGHSFSSKFVKIFGHEYISMAIIPLPLIQEEHGKNVC